MADSGGGDSVKFTINIETTVSSEQREEIKKELKKEITDEIKKETQETKSSSSKRSSITQQPASSSSAKKTQEAHFASMVDKELSRIERQRKREQRLSSGRKAVGATATGPPPISPPKQKDQRGGIYGDDYEKTVIDSKKAKQISGGIVPGATEDKKSKTGFSHDTFLDDVKKMLENQKKQEKATSPNSSSTAIDSSKSPLTAPKIKDKRGGIYGNYEKDVTDSKKAKQISGGIKSNERSDKKSKAAFSHNTFLDDIENLITDQKAIKQTQKLQIKRIDKIGDLANQVSSIVDKPGKFIGQGFLGIIGRGGPIITAVIAAISSAIAVSELPTKIIQVLSEKGHPANRDFKRAIEEEVNGLFNVDEKKKRLLGINSFIVSQTDRFQPESGSTSYNSLENRDEVIISRIGLAEKAVGII